MQLKGVQHASAQPENQPVPLDEDRAESMKNLATAEACQKNEEWPEICTSLLSVCHNYSVLILETLRRCHRV